jgi:hypothetical protein
MFTAGRQVGAMTLIQLRFSTPEKFEIGFVCSGPWLDSRSRSGASLEVRMIGWMSVEPDAIPCRARNHHDGKTTHEVSVFLEELAWRERTRAAMHYRRARRDADRTTNWGARQTEGGAAYMYSSGQRSTLRFGCRSAVGSAESWRQWGDRHGLGSRNGAGFALRSTARRASQD